MSRLRAGTNLMLGPREVMFNLRMGFYETTCYGLRASRIGEASPPGPLHQRRAGVLRDLQQNLFTQYLDSLTRAHSPSEHALVVDIPGEAMDVAKMLASLARRVASHDAAGRDIPQCIQQHRWSDLNCPLIWAAAAGGSESHPSIDWIGRTCANSSQDLSSDGSFHSIGDALESGWDALNRRFRAWGINSAEDFVAWTTGQSGMVYLAKVRAGLTIAAGTDEAERFCEPGVGSSGRGWTRDNSARGPGDNNEASE